MIISIKCAWESAKKRHKLYVEGIINNALVDFENRKLISRPLREVLENDAETLAVGEPAALRQLIGEIESKLTTTRIRRKFEKEAAEIFDYRAFCSKQSSGWNAYELCKVAKTSLCPYCQQSYAFTIAPTENLGSFRPTLDHFYSKSAYPYLALSLFNLVPSCYACNSSLKGQKNFFIEPHLHPFEDAEVVYFAIDIDDYLAWKSTPANGLRVRVASAATGADATKARNSISTFLLGHRFEPHFAEFSRFAQCLVAWTPGEIEKLRKTFGRNVSEAVLLNFDRNAYRSEMLGMIKRDIYNMVRGSLDGQNS